MDYGVNYNNKVVTYNNRTLVYQPNLDHKLTIKRVVGLIMIKVNDDRYKRVPYDQLSLLEKQLVSLYDKWIEVEDNITAAMDKTRSMLEDKIKSSSGDKQMAYINSHLTLFPNA